MRHVPPLKIESSVPGLHICFEIQNRSWVSGGRSFNERCTYNDLLIRGDELEGLLNDPAAVHLQGQGQHVASDPLRQSQLLVQATKLEPTNIQNKPVNDTVSPRQKLCTRRSDFSDTPQRTSG